MPGIRQPSGKGSGDTSLFLGLLVTDQPAAAPTPGPATGSPGASRGRRGRTGLGRTGRLFAHEHFGVAPDVMAIAKALANGLPMGALLATSEVAQAFQPGSHASTFGGGPVIARAAHTALSILSRPEFLTAVQDKGNYLAGRLAGLKNGFPVIREIRGVGLMWGLELAGEGAPVVNACRERGLLVNCTQGNVIRLLPPLIVGKIELDRGLAVLAEALKACFS